jgi:putative inorganic carbon (HCO3(-)) transporter
VEEGWIAQAYFTPGSSPHGRAAHSVYFQVLGDTGFVGLGIYLSAVAAALLNTVRVLALTRGRPELRWAGQLARLLQAGVAGFLMGGAALSMAYYDGVLLVFGLTAALYATISRPIAAQAAKPLQPRWARAEQALPIAGHASTEPG